MKRIARRGIRAFSHAREIYEQVGLAPPRAFCWPCRRYREDRDGASALGERGPAHRD